MKKPPDLDIPPEQKAIVADLMNEHNFDTLKETQAFAFEQGILDDDTNDLLVAPTGNGKTLTAEGVTKKHLQRDNRVAYLVPSSQLVRAKRSTIEEWASEDQVVHTGSRKFKYGDVVVCTYESYHQAIVRGVDGAKELDAVILDDFHELYSSYRGVDIELSIASALEHAEIYAISATIKDADEVASWIGGEAHISPEGRQIPIEEKAITGTSSSTKQQIVDVIEEEREKGPFLVFCYATSWTESRARAIAESKKLDGPPKQEVRNELQSRVDGQLTTTQKELVEIIAGGAGYIHSSVPYSIRNYILDLFEEEKIDAITSTTSLAYGFDSPVQSAIVADEKRRGEWINVYEYIQFAGRAARPRFDYDKGYCFTLTNDPEEAEERFFKPDRNLEEVESHIDDDDAFRWAVVSLIEYGWDNPTDLTQFFQRTLYYEQMSGRSGKEKEEQMKTRVTETANWLESEGFIEISETWGSYSTTYLGEGAVAFKFSSWVDAKLNQVKQFYNWAEDTDQTELRQIDLIHKVVEIFGLEMRESQADKITESALEEYGFRCNEVGITTGLIRWHWMKNRSMERIEEDTGIDPTYLPGLASKVTKTIEATEHLVTASPNAHKCGWEENLQTRIEKGVNEDAVSIINGIDSVGRTRVRLLRYYLESMAQNQMEVDKNKPLYELLNAFRDYCSSDDQFEEMLADKVDMVGPVVAEKIRDQIDSIEQSEKEVATEEEDALNREISNIASVEDSEFATPGEEAITGKNKSGSDPTKESKSQSGLNQFG